MLTEKKSAVRKILINTAQTLTRTRIYIILKEMSVSVKHVKGYCKGFGPHQRSSKFEKYIKHRNTNYINYIRT